MTHPKRLLTYSILVCTLLLPACSQRVVSVEVRNDAGRAVSATIGVDKLSERRSNLTRANIGAGQTALLGPVPAPALEFVELRVKPRGGAGELPASVRLPRGRSVAVVEGGWDGLRVRLLNAPAEQEDSPRRR